MTYQGEHARPIARDRCRSYQVSKVRIGADGHVSDVLWGELDAGANRAVSDPVRAPVADVVDAIHDGAQVVAVFTSAKPPRPEREFVVVEHDDGSECIDFAKASSPGRNLSDMANLDD